MSINESIKCNYNDLFTTIEEILYKKYPYLRNNMNVFLVNGKKIEKNQTILYNEIANNSFSFDYRY